MDKVSDLREQAARCRRLVAGLNDAKTMALLRQLADEYDERAIELEGKTAPER